MKTKDGRDVSVLDVTAENYLVPKGEERTYHVRIEVKQFDPKTGKRISTPRIQKFGKKIWQNNIRLSLRKQGYEFEILHDPVKWEQENAERIAAIKAAKIQAQQEAAQQAMAEERAKMKAEIMAELIAAGVVPGNLVEETKKPGRPKAKTEE